mmetsp:Transcript_63278/g.136008  ORF Transcript_63278/g.136008 Transcript_63278/m.136008 type:complete len:411 (+) Transcript_63278:3439-4671(+)
MCGVRQLDLQAARMIEVPGVPPHKHLLVRVVVEGGHQCLTVELHVHGDSERSPGVILPDYVETFLLDFENDGACLGRRHGLQRIQKAQEHHLTLERWRPHRDGLVGGLGLHPQGHGDLKRTRTCGLARLLEVLVRLVPEDENHVTGQDGDTGPIAISINSVLATFRLTWRHHDVEGLPHCLSSAKCADKPAAIDLTDLHASLVGLVQRYLHLADHILRLWRSLPGGKHFLQVRSAHARRALLLLLLLATPRVGLTLRALRVHAAAHALRLCASLIGMLLVVLPARGAVAEDLVGLLDLLEFILHVSELFRLLVPVLVRMKLERQLLIGSLDILHRGEVVYLKQLIVVHLCVELLHWRNVEVVVIGLIARVSALPNQVTDLGELILDLGGLDHRLVEAGLLPLDLRTIVLR